MIVLPNMSSKACLRARSTSFIEIRCPEVFKTCDTVIHDATGYDTVKMLKVRADIQADAMIAHPFAQSDAERCNFVFFHIT